jgi:hypothetical protein
MKNVLRTFGLVTLISLAWLSNANAGTCSIRCSNGQSFSFSTTSGSSCCSQIDVLCPNGGRGSYNGQQCAL